MVFGRRIPSTHASAYSSVGRAGDCRWLQLISLGHWFDSGCADNFFFGAPVRARGGCRSVRTLTCDPPARTEHRHSPPAGASRRDGSQGCHHADQKRMASAQREQETHPCLLPVLPLSSPLPHKLQQKGLRSPGIEPGSITWQATIITTRPRTRCGSRWDFVGPLFGTRAPLTQSVEYWSYEPKVVGSSPTWSSGCLYAPRAVFWWDWCLGLPWGKKRGPRDRRAEGGFEPLGRQSPLDLKSKP